MLTFFQKSCFTVGTQRFSRNQIFKRQNVRRTLHRQCFGLGAVIIKQLFHGVSLKRVKQSSNIDEPTLFDEKFDSEQTSSNSIKHVFFQMRQTFHQTREFDEV